MAVMQNSVQWCIAHESTMSEGSARKVCQDEYYGTDLEEENCTFVLVNISYPDRYEGIFSDDEATATDAAKLLLRDNGFMFPGDSKLEALLEESKALYKRAGVEHPFS